MRHCETFGEAVELYLEPQPGQLPENERAEVVEIS